MKRCLSETHSINYWVCTMLRCIFRNLQDKVGHISPECKHQLMIVAAEGCQSRLHSEHGFGK